MGKIYVFIIAFISIFSCRQTDAGNFVNTNEENSVIFDSLKIETSVPTINKDTNLLLKFNGYSYQTIIKVPDSSLKFYGTILVLHGWNFPADDWCNKTALCEKALKKGYILVLPEMGKSTYSNYYFPQTRKDWLKYPTRKWLLDTLLVHLQNNLQLLLPNHSNYVLGLSTGGKGAALTALDKPNIFKAAAVLSADFDHTLLPNDNIYKGFYGNYDQFKKRWKEEDNLIFSIVDFKVPVYLGHGLKDNISPAEQTVMFHDSLQLYHPQLKCILHIDSTAKHDYKYWNSEVDAMLEFFDH